MTQTIWLEVRYLLYFLAWAVVAALAAAAGCWCCGYAAREAWLKIGPPVRRPRRIDLVDEVDDEVGQEAARGILEIEAYLSRAGGTPRGDLR